VARRRRGRSPHAPPADVTDAVVARIHDYAETSAVAVLITRDCGGVRAVAKGARRMKNGYRGPLDCGVLYRVRIARRGGEGLHHLTSSEVREAFPRLRRDPARFVASALVLEVASDLIRENEPNPELFGLTVFSLKALDRAPNARVPMAVTLFLARAVAISGHVPEIEHCIACGEPLTRDERPMIGLTRGGVLHQACAQGDPGSRSVPGPVLDLLSELWTRPAAEILDSNPPRDHLRALRRLLVDWLEHTLERRFRAAFAVDREFGPGLA